VKEGALVGKRKRLKIRIAVSAAVAVISLAVTPFIFKLTEAERYYTAYGGETFIPIITLFSVLFTVEGIR